MKIQIGHFRTFQEFNLGYSTLRYKMQINSGSDYFTKFVAINIFKNQQKLKTSHFLFNILSPKESLKIYQLMCKFLQQKLYQTYMQMISQQEGGKEKEQKVFSSLRKVSLLPRSKKEQKKKLDSYRSNVQNIKLKKT